MAKPTKTKPPQLKLNGKPLAMAMDGHTITLKNDGGGELVFFQITNQSEDGSLEATGFCTIRANINQLKALSSAIIGTIENHEKVLKERQEK